MNCFKHHDRAAEYTCEACKEPLCRECKLSLGEHIYCRDCVKSLLREETFEMQRELPQNVNNKAYRSGKSRFWTFLLSCIPGAGYMYLGLMKRGLQAMVTFFGAVFVSDLISMGSIMALILPVLMFYTIFDTQQLVRKINAGEKVKDEELFRVNWLKIEHKWIGYGLIAIGALALLNNTLPLLFDTYVFRAVVGPILIIVVGIYILSRSTRNQKGVD